MKAKILRLKLPPGRRILAISDIHGNLPYLTGLLEKIKFSRGDILILLGDMMEKGGASLETLRHIMELSETMQVYPIRGNCDLWCDFLFRSGPESDSRLLHYMRYQRQGLISQMCAEIGVPVTRDMDMENIKTQVKAVFKKELSFLRGLPTLIETKHYTFVHGGLPEGELDELDAASCMKNDDFMNQGRSFDKWCVVGHWPVMLYCEDITCANPIIDRENKIVSIDGGCVLKDDGQLNALIIPYDGSEAFSFEHYDPFPIRRAATPQEASPHSAYIRWGDNEVRVLCEGSEFSLCEHIRTGYRLDILTKYLEGSGDTRKCNDCTDYILPLNPGDEVSVIEETSRGYLVKHKGVSGWYFGRLEDAGDCPCK